MAKVRTTLTIDDEVLRAVRLRAARSGKGDSQVIEEALRRDLGVGVLDALWKSVEPMAEDDAMALALEAQDAARQAPR